MSEYLNVTAVGSSREAAIADADKQAEQYFGVSVDELVRDVGRATPVQRVLQGRVTQWELSVDYTRRE